MNIASHYKLSHFMPWTRRYVYKMIILSIIPTAIFYFFGWHWLAIPWVPVALIGTATAFIAGFKNTQTYNRMWEARTIWGAIINSSRTFGIMTKDFIRANNKTEEAAMHQRLLYQSGGNCSRQ